jgi:hypothetical protein
MTDDRRPNPSDPTAERTTESSTQTASGLSGGRPGMEQGHRDDHPDDVIPRSGEDTRTTPRRYDDDDSDPVMPTDDATLGTKI